MGLLSEKYPDISKEFDTSKNCGKAFDDYSECSGKKVWWICESGHSWEAVFNTRTKRGYGCPFCSGKRIISGVNDFLTLYPEIASEIDIEKNHNINFSKLAGKSHVFVYWKCTRGHGYRTTINKRTVRGDGCPFCSGRYPIVGETDLLSKRPDLMKYWDYSKNKDVTEYTPCSAQNVFWKCSQNHSWKRAISVQSISNCCPICSNRMLLKGYNDLETKYPDISKEWDEIRNGISASDVKAKWGYIYWWKCSKNHSWQSTLGNRVKGEGCPYCCGKYALKGERNLLSLFPQIAKEWNYEKNRLLSPEEFLPFSNKKVWWICEKGHEWRARIADRTYKATGCPWCNSNKYIYKKR